jgi:hypothetical protein
MFVSQGYPVPAPGSTGMNGTQSPAQPFQDTLHREIELNQHVRSHFREHPEFNPYFSGDERNYDNNSAGFNYANDLPPKYSEN